MKRIFTAAIIGILVCDLSGTAMAYDRDAAVVYATRWGVPTLGHTGDSGAVEKVDCRGVGAR